MSLMEEGKELDLKEKGSMMHNHHKLKHRETFGEKGLVHGEKLHEHHLEK